MDFSYVFSTLKFSPKIRHFFLQFCLIILAKCLFLPLYKIFSRIFSKTTSYQQNESVIQMLKKGARVIVTGIVLHCSLITPHRHFSYYDKNMGSWQGNTTTTVPLEAVPECRTEQCSPRLRPGDRFCEPSFRYLSPGSEGEKYRPLHQK